MHLFVEELTKAEDRTFVSYLSFPQPNDDELLHLCQGYNISRKPRKMSKLKATTVKYSHTL